MSPKTQRRACGLRTLNQSSFRADDDEVLVLEDCVAGKHWCPVGFVVVRENLRSHVGMPCATKLQRNLRSVPSLKALGRTRDLRVGNVLEVLKDLLAKEEELRDDVVVVPENFQNSASLKS